MAAAALVTALAACVQTKPYQAANTGAAGEGARVLLMPPDVLVLEREATGVMQPRADWTEDVKQALTEALRDQLEGGGATLARYRVADGVVPYAKAHRATVAMHQTVLQSILAYRYQGERQGPSLATKGESLDWTLGEAVAPLAADYDADYALFLSYQQATSSAGRALLTAAAVVLFGAIQPTSQSVGLASLVDVRSGDVVWTNVVQGQALDVSKPSNVRDRAEQLMAEFPL